LIGTVISRYEICGEIGSGARGTVYKARDLDLERWAALRVLSVRQEAEPERLIREAAALSGIQHPNLCPVYEAGWTAAGDLFLATAYCDGETLAERLERGPLKPAAAVELAAQIAAGLAAAHEQGIVHRNLCPASLFLSADGQAKIVDFGFSSPMEQTVTSAPAPAAGMPYAAPEQLRGERTDARTDLWSLGAVLYEMLTGERPSALSALEPLAARRPEAPAELARIVARALALRPAERYATAAELHGELRALRASGSQPIRLPDSAGEEPARVLGPYRLQSRIGAGGMATVWRAADTRLGRAVALKLLPSDLTRDATARARFQQEAQAASALEHPNICTIFDVGEAPGGQLYLAMPCYEGETLRRRLERGPLPLDEALDIGAQIARGLAKAHRQGILHRDIKPANLMLTVDGVVKILDFGIAKLMGGAAGLTRLGGTVGTPAYMSPEQMRGEEVDPRTDLWSLGVVLYEMVAGRRPFPGDDPTVVRAAVLAARPEPLRVRRPEVPEELERIVDGLLQKDARERPPDADSVAAALRTLSGGSETSGALAARRPARSRLRWGLGGLAFAGLAALAGVLLVRSMDSRRPAEPLRAAFTRLTDQEGRETFPSLSPKGDFFVYVKAGEGGLDIYLQRIGGGNPIDLTADSPADDTQPAFSPDGSQIAFRSKRDGGGIFLMGATGESVRRLTDFGYNPAWSPDGRRLAVATDGTADPLQHGRDSEIWVVEIATGAKRKVVSGDGLQPSWSPGGRRLAYWGVAAGSGRRVLWTVPAAGGAAVPVLDDGAVNWNPVWAPDGGGLYFASDRGGSMNLWRIAVDESSGRATGEPEPVTTPSSWSGLMSFAADGRHLAFVAGEKQANLERLDFDPVSLRAAASGREVTQGSRTVRSCDVSPDGQWIAFDVAAAQEDLFLVRADGTGLRRITNDPAKDRVPRWSPDGSRILFYTNRNGVYQAWTIHPDGSSPEQLTQVPSPGLVFPLWSPDGRRLCATAVSKGSAFLDLTLPMEQRLPKLLRPVRDGVGLFVTAWSPDGKRLAGNDPSGSGIGIFTLDTGLYEKLTENGWGPVWLQDNRTLLYLDRGNVLAVDSTTRKVSDVLTKSARSPYGALCVSRDGRSLYVTRETDEADIWMLALQGEAPVVR
jgi:serine/threonine protein kinase/Tol biopolymer transport system component